MRQHFLGAMLLVSFLFGASGAMACEKHLNGHQNSSDTNAEGIQK